jgi:tetratricopeptide (TPR) repeat protein
MRAEFPSIFILLAGLMFLNASAMAQEELDEDRKVEKRQESAQTMTEPIYRRLNSIHEMLAEEKYADAMSALAKMENMRLNKYEEALMAQTYGFAYVQQAQYQQALDYFEKSLALNALPALAQQGMLYSLAGLYAAEGQYLKCIETMREWFRYEEDPIADAYMVIGSALTELERFDEALPYVQKAIQKAEEPKENWYLLELAIYFEKERYRDAASLLKEVVQIWPDNPKYWDMLASSYLELKEDKAALDTLMIAYTKGLLSSESKIMAVVQLNMIQDIPYTAGVILEKELEAGRVEANKKNLDILLQAWLSAREYDRAVATIDRLAPVAKDGTYFMQKAGIHNELGQWQQVIAAVDQALETGLDKPAEAHMLAGMAYTELKEFSKAIASFRSAKQSGTAKQRQNADAWIDFVNEKIQIKSVALNE